MSRSIVFLFSCLLIAAAVAGQCPDKDSLWKKLTWLSDNASITWQPVQLQDQLKELSGWEEKMKPCGTGYDLTHAFILQRIGSIYAQQSEWIKAIHTTRRSIGILSGLSQNASPVIKIQVKNYYNLSVYYAALNRGLGKREALDSCINIAIRSKYTDDIAIYALFEKAQYLFEAGDYERCIRYASWGETMTGDYTNGTDSIDYVINFFALKVNALINYKNYTTAENSLVQKISDCKKLKATHHLGTLYELLAEVSLAHGDRNKALNYFQKAVYADGEAGFYLGCMQSLNNLGYLLYFQYDHDPAKALSAFKKALKYANNNQYTDEQERIEILNVLKNTAKVYSSSGNYSTARKYIQLAFDQISPGINENSLVNRFDDFAVNKTAMYLTGLIMEKADIFLEQYKRTKDQQAVSEALRIYKVADRFLNRIRRGQEELLSKLFWRSNSRRLYEQAIEASYQSNNTEDAFYFLEKSRAVLLDDQLKEQRVLGEENMLKTAQLKKKIWLLEKEAQDKKTTAARNTQIQQEILINKQESDHLLRTIQLRNPSYYNNMLDTVAISVAQMRKVLLKDRLTLVELFAGDSAVYTMIVTGQQLTLSKIDKSEFDSAANEYISYISNESALNSHFDAFVNTSHRLYKLIFPNQLPPGRIIISPDGRYFPFEPLVSAKQESALSYLLHKHTISYTYSARYLMHQYIGQPALKARNFLGVAPIKYPAVFHLAALKGSDLSLNKIEQYFSGADQLVSNKASKDIFLKEYSKYRIIQLYTHATDSGSAGEPEIYFADSVLYLSELIPENYPATELIVLSACETAKGKIYLGEGVFSFSRSFAALGIRSSITNLWSVENQSTYRLTELFYRFLAEGLPSDVALQQAKLEFINTASKQQSLPFFWAAPILTGQATRLTVEKKHSWRMAAACICIAVIGFWGLLRIAKRTSAK